MTTIRMEMTGRTPTDGGGLPVPCNRPSIAPWCERVRQAVSADRYRHILRVASLAEEIARANGFSEDEVRATLLAAVLHDSARELPAAQLLRLAPARVPVEAEHPLTVHGRASRRMAELWGVSDKRVLEAIEGHVFGVDEANRIGVALYIADVSEPGRNVNADIRALALTDLAAAYRKAVRAKVQYLLSVGKPVHPDTLRVHEAIDTAP